MALVFKYLYSGPSGPVYKGILTAKVGTDRKAEEAQRRARKQYMEKIEQAGQLKLGGEDDQGAFGQGE